MENRKLKPHMLQKKKKKWTEWKAVSFEINGVSTGFPGKRSFDVLPKSNSKEEWLLFCF